MAWDGILWILYWNQRKRHVFVGRKGDFLSLCNKIKRSNVVDEIFSQGEEECQNCRNLLTIRQSSIQNT